MLNKKSACVGVLYIIELKNARWKNEIELSCFVSGCVYVSVSHFGVFDQLTLVIQRHFVRDGERALVLAELESTDTKETRSNFELGGVERYIFEQGGVEKYIFEHL